MEKRVCTKCKKEQPLSEFCKNKNSKDGINYQCKTCVEITSKKWRKNNRERVNTNARNWHNNNKDKSRASSRKWRKNNRDECLEKLKEWRADNVEHRAQYRRDHYEEHKDEINEYRRGYNKKRKKEDPLFKLKLNISKNILTTFKRKNHKKQSKSLDILGCGTWENFYTHIEGFFYKHPGMGWHNRHLWHLDHIIPISSAKTEEEVYELNRYTNFQPLWAKDNLSKGSKMPEDFQKRLL